MPAKDLGQKFTCFKCTTKFYDLKKPDPVCPKCGTDQREVPTSKGSSEGRRSRLAAVPKVIEPAEPAEEEAAEEEDELEALDDDDDDEELPVDDD
jgi:uncharacterized protein (TIGR02300 family)